MAILYLIYKPISILLDWRHFKFLFTNNELCIHEGRFFKTKRFIPLDNIQGINQNTSFFHRFFGFTSLILNTGSSGDDSSVKLEMISNKEAAQIREFLTQVGYIKGIDKQEQQIPVTSGTDQFPKRNHYEITSKELFISSIISLRFLFFVVVLYSVYSDINDFISLDKYIDAIISFFQQSWLLTVLGVIAFIILSMGYGVLKTHIQYRNFVVTSDGYRIFIKKGMFTKTEFSIPKEKVQAININATFLQRCFRIVVVKIVSISDTDNEEIRISNILFPFIDKDRAALLISEILPGFRVESGMTKIPRTSIFVKIVRSSYFWIGGPAIIFNFWPELWYLSVALFIIFITSQVLSGLQSKYKLHDPFIQFQKGGLSTRLFVTKRVKIEELKMTESWLQRKFGLATIHISTRANPIKRSKISDIPKDIAIQYYQWYANNDNKDIEQTKPYSHD